MSRPLVSVLLPVRDASAWLEASLRSLRRQTLEDFEIVAVDDGSEDDSLALLEGWRRKDSRLRILARERLGIAPALQAGFEAARGKWIARQDADDISHPRRLELLAGRLAEASDLDVVGSRIRGFPRALVTRGMRRYERWQNGLLEHGEMRRERYVESPLAHASALMRRQPLEVAGGWLDPPWPEDLDLWLRMFRMGARFGKLPDELYFWRERPNRTTRTDPRLSLEAFRRCKIHHLGEELLGRPPASVTLWSAGRLGRTWQRALEEAGYQVSREEIDPKGGEPLPAPPEDEPLLLAIGHPRHRDNLRRILANRDLEEEKHHLFV